MGTVVNPIVQMWETKAQRDRVTSPTAAQLGSGTSTVGQDQGGAGFESPRGSFCLLQTRSGSILIGCFSFFAIPSELNNFIAAKKGFRLQGRICSLSPELAYPHGVLLPHLF